MKEFIKKHFAAIVVNTIGVIANVIAIVEVVNKFKQSQFDTRFYIFLNILIVSSFVIIAGWIVYLKIIQTLRKRAYIVNDLNNITRFIHSEVIHIIRDGYKSYSNNENNISQIKTVLNMIVRDFSKTISTLANKEISVCIKQIIPENSDNILTWNVKTSARYCPRNHHERAKNDSKRIPINGNTDFESIAKGASFFICGDLPKLQSEGKYVNTNPSYGIFYNSSMSMPIRCVIRNNEIWGDDKCDIIGFLCIDCLEKDSEWGRENNYIFNMSAILADALYILIDAYMNFNATKIKRKRTINVFS